MPLFRVKPFFAVNLAAVQYVHVESRIGQWPVKLTIVTSGATLPCYFNTEDEARDAFDKLYTAINRSTFRVFPASDSAEGSK